MESKKIIIDIRDESELLEKKLSSTDKDIIIFNIPMRNIFFNKETIKKLSENNKVYILCRSGNRSQKVKDLYFKKNKNIISIARGINNLNENKEFKNIIINSGNGGFGIQQYMQLIFVIILFIIILLLYANIGNNYIIYFSIFVLIFILYQLVSKSCIISKIVPLPSL